MEQNTPKFRLRLNLFDGIILVLALAVGALVIWSALKPRAASPEAPSVSTYRYTVCFQRWPAGDSRLLQAGDQLMDSTKNYPLGQVVDFEVVPSEILILNQETRRYELTPVPGYEDIYVTVESTGTEREDEIVLGGGFSLRAGVTAYIRGAGYMAAGPITGVQREEVQP